MLHESMEMKENISLFVELLWSCYGVVMSGYRLRNSVPVVIIEKQKNVKVAVCNLDLTEMEK